MDENGVVTTPGQYYLAIQNPQQVAQNASAQAIFTGQAALIAVIGQFKLLMLVMLAASPLVLFLRKPRQRL